MKHTLKMLIILMAIGCMPGNKDKTVQKPNENKKEKVVIYQMMTRLFGNKKSNNIKYGTREENGVGKFNDITTKALREIKALGITHVWYTGVIEHAIVSDYSDFGIAIDDADVVKGRAGSPYAIKDYYDVNPDLAASVPDRLNEFRQLIGRTHEAGMKVIIDFVPNHVARTYVSDASPGGTSDFGEKDDTSVTFVGG
jgi:glycosidase